MVPGNYRPISMTLVLCMILEQIEGKNRDMEVKENKTRCDIILSKSRGGSRSVQ